MKRLFSRSGWLIVILVPALLLVACERPLQREDTGASPTPLLTTPAQVTIPAGASPTAELGYPAPGEEGVEAYPGPDVDATPAPEGEQPTAPAPTASPDATAQPGEDIVHVVAAGDTLGAIALRYGVSVDAIAAANNLSNIHTLDVGQELVIPSGEETTAPAETPDAEEPATEEQVHIVQAGETLYRIGLRYGFTVEALAAYNDLANPADLDVGQRILIPPEGYTP